MKINKTFRFFGRKAGLLMTAALFAAGLVWSQGCKKGVEDALVLFLRVLTPSLFPFMALSALCVRTGLCAKLGRRLERPTRLLFGLNGVFAPVLLLSLTGGYPVGARAIAQLYEAGQIREKEAKHAALFCVCAGPGFVLSYIGGLYGSQALGTVMLVAQILAVILSGIGLKFLLKNYHISDKEIRAPALPFSTALVMAAKEAQRRADGMASVGGMPRDDPAVARDLLRRDLAHSARQRRALRLCGRLRRLMRAFSDFCRAGKAAREQGFIFLCENYSGLSDSAFHAFRHEAAPGADGFFDGDYLTSRFFRRQYPLRRGTDDRVGGVFVFIEKKVGFFGGSILSGAALMTVSVVFLCSLRKR